MTQGRTRDRRRRRVDFEFGEVTPVAPNDTLTAGLLDALNCLFPQLSETAK